MDDQALVSALLARTEDAAAALLKQYGALIRYVAGGILTDERETEECVNDVCLTVWQKAVQYDPDRASFSAWLTAVARNTAINRLRAGSRQPRPGPEEPGEPVHAATPETELLKKERAEALRAAVARLGDRERQLFYRKYYYLQSTEKIAAEMGLTPRGVEGRLYRLRAKLRTMLGGEAL